MNPIEYARSHHDREYGRGLKLMELARENAALALKSMFLLNGGAAIAVLTFIGGAFVETSNKPNIQPLQLFDSLAWFSRGAAAAVVAMAFAYFAAACAANASHNLKRVWPYPYHQETPASKRWQRGSLIAEVLAVLSALASIGFLFWGISYVEQAANLGVTG